LSALLAVLTSATDIVRTRRELRRAEGSMTLEHILHEVNRN
jgi:hypothetical protein